MRKLLLITMLLVFSVAANAQNDVTRFLGIPVDGSKSEMIRKIKAKGYRSISYDSDVLEGEFNGRDVHIHVATNNDKVYRVMVSDVNAVDERSIQIRFNKLCEQFANNSKYISLKEQTIPDNENISYEMTVKKKRYEAIFYQKPVDADTVIAENLLSIIQLKYTEEQLENPTEEIQSEILELFAKCCMEYYQKRPVWFVIHEEHHGEYSISIYYDNGYNQAAGEDL
nr:hypothetical protein [uncultured Alistipes sp.]